MKKIIIYLFLSLILVVPIAAIVAVGIMSSEENIYYSDEKYSSDL